MNQVAKRTEPEIMVPGNNAMTPMDMLDRAVASGANIEVIEKLMALQERWDANNARKSFNDAIAAAKAEIKPIVRDKKGHNGKRYVSFDAIARVVDPILSKHKLIYRFRSEQVDNSINVTCVLSHGNHHEETTLSGPADTSGSKNAIQAIGSTLTYLQRYSLVQMLGLAAADDDDAKQAAGGEDLLSAAQVLEMKQLIVDKGADLAKFLKWAKVEQVEDIGAAYFESCIEAIKAAGKK